MGIHNFDNKYRYNLISLYKLFDFFFVLLCLFHCPFYIFRSS